MPEEEKEKNAQEPKVGVFVCHCGGNISDVIDVKRVTEEVSKIPGVEVARDYLFMCSDPGQKLIADAIRNDGINRVVVAACSPRLHELTFRRKLVDSGLNPYLLEQANIREQASWVHKTDPGGATAKAVRLAAAAVEKVKLMKPLDRIEVESLPYAAVIGGGVAGIRTALDLADKGSQVFLIEKTPFLGGNMPKLDRLFPTEDVAKEILGRLLEELRANEKVNVHTLTELTGTEGYIGNFKLQVRKTSRGFKRALSDEEYERVLEACPEEVEDAFNEGLSRRKAIYRPYRQAYPEAPAIDWETCTGCGKCRDMLGEQVVDLERRQEDLEIEAGTVIVATGFRHYEPYEGEYGYRESEQVITLPQLIRLLDPEGPTRGELSLDGRRIRNIGFIHCVGSRQQEGVNRPGKDGKLNEHCSRVCCTATLQAAKEIKKRHPGVRLFDFYQDIRTYGRDHETVYYEEASRNGTLFFRYDPNEPPSVDRNTDGKGPPLTVKVRDLLTMKEEVEVDLDLLVLATGMVPPEIDEVIQPFKLPVGSDRFLLEIHPKLRPVESAIGGVYLAGTAQAPMDITETTAAASAAGVKAAAILQGKRVELEPYVAKVDEALCEGVGACVEACHYKGAITLVDREVDGRKVKRAEVNFALCKGCGACVAVCPRRALDVNGFEIRQFEAMMNAIAGA
jgi:heterodisulfide reductase subunit A